MFLAAARCTEDTTRMFAEAAEGLEGEAARHPMGTAHRELVSERPERPMMQRCLAVAAAEQEGDHEFAEAVRAGWSRLWDTVHLVLGADVRGTAAFIAHGMLSNCLVTMGFPPELVDPFGAAQ